MILIGRTSIAICLCAASVACSSNSEKLTKEIQDASSSISSARVVAKFYADGAVPKAYARDALESFDQQLQSTAQRIQSNSDPRAPQVSATLQRAQQTIEQIEASIDQPDHLSLAQFDVQLDNAQRTLTTLSDQTGPSPSP